MTNLILNPGLDNTYRKGRTWARVQIATQCSFCTKKSLVQSVCSFIHFVMFLNCSEIVHVKSSFAFCSNTLKIYIIIYANVEEVETSIKCHLHFVAPPDLTKNKL